MYVPKCKFNVPKTLILVCTISVWCCFCIMILWYYAVAPIHIMCSPEIWREYNVHLLCICRLFWIQYRSDDGLSFPQTVASMIFLSLSHGEPLWCQRWCLTLAVSEVVSVWLFQKAEHVRTCRCFLASPSCAGTVNSSLLEALTGAYSYSWV